MRGDDYGRIEAAILFLERNFRGQPRLDEVARSVGLSEYHFHRLFTRWAGISPKRFLQFLTAEHARGLLRESSSVLEAAYGAGLSGPGRLHDLVVNVYAVTPGELKAMGEDLTIRYGVHRSPFGECLIAVTERGICGLSFLSRGGKGEALDDLRKKWERATLAEDPGGTKAVARRVFDPARLRGRLPWSVVVRGTNFQVRVWEALVRIPPGCILSYGAVAAAAGAPGAVRAAGSAVGRNPVAFIIPCHRVIRSTGAFGEYGGGAARKKAILAWEAAHFPAGAGPARPRAPR